MLRFRQPWLIGNILPFWPETSHNERMATVEMCLRKPPLSETLEKPVYLVSRGKIREAETGGSYYWNKR